MNVDLQQTTPDLLTPTGGFLGSVLAITQHQLLSITWDGTITVLLYSGAGAFAGWLVREGLNWIKKKIE